MARITKTSVTFCALLFILPYTPLALASPQASSTAIHKAHAGKTTQKSSSKTVSNKKTKNSTAKIRAKTPSKKATASRKTQTAPAAKTKMVKRRNSKPLSESRHAGAGQTAMIVKCTKPRKGYKQRCEKVKATAAGTTIASAHKQRVHSARQTALNTLMDQLGKPYRWGGTSPRTGFDCSGLVYYAYKDLVKFRIPRTANEMYHLRDAAPVSKSELVTGDLVFFRTQGRGTADHVGVYVGNGKFIQSPRTGRDIQITSLSEDYWQRHYVGARRVMTPKNVR
ncbi:C40 family peptidase [Entomohabitans teleogrylli]|uniref:C40 family peptidase n=1 Tax=Entomohabitans teleogrylli TaxID=1384589 RepID=UPI00073D7E69|nr:C40 family peptidase [Entomohabitans teleogrylli]